MNAELTNLAERASHWRLTVNDVKNADIYNVLHDADGDGYSVLYWACQNCPTEVVEAILDKTGGANMNNSVGMVRTFTFE
jgi:hypothetical protein